MYQRQGYGRVFVSAMFRKLGFIVAAAAVAVLASWMGLR